MRQREWLEDATSSKKQNTSICKHKRRKISIIQFEFKNQVKSDA